MSFQGSNKVNMIPQLLQEIYSRVTSFLNKVEPIYTTDDKWT